MRLQRGVDPSSVSSMTNVEVKSFDSADIKNVLPDDLGEAAIVEFGDVKVTQSLIAVTCGRRVRHWFQVSPHSPSSVCLKSILAN